MAKNSQATLQFLKEMAAQEAVAKMQSMAEAMQHLDAAKGQLSVLQHYQTEYGGQLSAGSAKGMDGILYLNFRRFSQQLEQAAQEQVTKIERLAQIVHEKKQDWQLAQRKQKSYEVLIARALQQAQKIELKRDQKLMDEFAGRVKRA